MPPYPKFANKLNQIGDQVKTVSINHNQDLWDAYNLVGGLLENLLSVNIEDSRKSGRHISERFSLTANMAQAFYVVEQLISEGAYWSASAVLRQHMETLARLVGYRTGSLGNGKNSPESVSILPLDLRRNYGRLSQFCHTSDGEVLEDFSSSGTVDAAALTPIFRQEWARGLFFIHIEHMLVLAHEIWYLYSEIHPNKNLPGIEYETEEIAELFVAAGLWRVLDHGAQESV